LATKGGKIHRVFLIAKAFDAVRTWLDQLASYAPRNPLRLAFPLPDGSLRPVDNNTPFLEDWHTYRKRAGIERYVRWYDLRHTCASSLLCGWWSDPWTLAEVQAYLGHSSPLMTARYAHLADSALKAKVKKTSGGNGGYGGGLLVTNWSQHSEATGEGSRASREYCSGGPAGTRTRDLRIKRAGD
jgi:integrase